MNQLVYRTTSLAALLGVSVATIWRMEAAGQLPKSFKLTAHQTVWDAKEITDFLEEKKEARFNQLGPAGPVSPITVKRGRNPVAATSRTDAKRPGRPRKDSKYRTAETDHVGGKP